MRWPMIIIAILVYGLTGLAMPGLTSAQEPELVIVKYGRLVVNSPVPDAKVYVDDFYKGPAGSMIEGIMVGEHVISCRIEGKTVAGTFLIRKDDTLKLEARFDENKLVIHVDREKTEAEKKPKTEPVVAKPEVVAVAPKPETPKPEKPKKPAPEPKKAERKNPEEERRALHLNVFRATFDDIDTQEPRIGHKTNAKVISKYTEKKNYAGKYYQTKKGMLLCDTGPCEQEWTVAFTYTDEAGTSDSFSLTWKQTVFNGITPAGTSKRDLVHCLNSKCGTLLDNVQVEQALNADLGRYNLYWSKSQLVIRRSDIAREIMEAGGSLDAY